MSTVFLLAMPLGCFAMADADMSPLGGASGWAGAGLLSLMLGWLCLRYLPEQDRRMDKHIVDEREMMKALNKQMADTLTTLVCKFDESSTKAAERCEVERRETREAFQKMLEQRKGQMP